MTARAQLARIASWLPEWRKADARHSVADLDATIADMLNALEMVQRCPQAAPWLARMPTGSGSVWDAVAAAIIKARGE